MATAKEIEAHVTKELKLKEEADALLERLESRDYRTKTEKRFISDSLKAKRQELREHIENAPS